MGFFSRSKKDTDIGHARKLSTYDVHDPILTAIRDEEPFQQSAYSEGRVGISPEMRVRDIFGNVIVIPTVPTPRGQQTSARLTRLEHLSTPVPAMNG